MLDIKEIISNYKDVLEGVSKEADRLAQHYKEHMVCKKGCSACCTDISLLPIEWYALKTAVSASMTPFVPGNQTGYCALLKENACTFYARRPLICRTHGLPLLYLAEEYDESGGRVEAEAPDWQISWCDLNFSTVTEETMEDIFDPEDVLNMEEWNSFLRELNQEFLETEEGIPFRGKDRISLGDIFTEG